MYDDENNHAYASTKASGVGVTGLLGVAFIVLKLCQVIDWPWIWVLSPIWIPFVIFVVILIGFAFFLLIKHIKRKNKQRNNYHE